MIFQIVSAVQFSRKSSRGSGPGGEKPDRAAHFVAYIIGANSCNSCLRRPGMQENEWTIGRPAERLHGKWGA